MMRFWLVALTFLSLAATGQCSVIPGQIVRGAKAQLTAPARYDPGYYRIPFPGGDVPADRGACTDVVIRALRVAGIDLQALIQQDMRIRFTAYPRRGAKRDPNIDHRRVPNQMAFLRRYAKSLPIGTSEADRGRWQPGDLVYWKLDSGLDHVGILSDRRNAQGWPLVIHNLSQTREEDCLKTWRTTGHFRILKHPVVR